MMFRFSRHVCLAGLCVFMMLFASQAHAAPSKKLQKLIQTLKQGSAAQKTAAARTLSKMGKRAAPAVSALSVLLLTGPQAAHPHVERALRNAGDASIAALFPLYGARRARDAKKTATRILRKLGPKASDKTIEAMMRMFTMRHSRHHSGLTKAFAAMGPAIIPKLEKHIAAKWTTVLAQKAVAKAAMEMGSKGHAFLRRLLKHPNKYVRQQSAQACQEEGDPCAPVVKALAARKDDSDKWTRWYAVWAISEQKPATIARVQDALYVFFDDKWKNVRIKARAAFARLGPKALPGLRKMLRTGDPKTKTRACLILSAMKSKAAPAKSDLLPLLKHDNNVIRLRALHALGQIGPKARSAIPHIQGLLKREDQTSVLYQAIDSLGALGTGTEAQCATLRPFATHRELLVRMRAVKHLGDWKDRKSIPLFKRALRDKHEYVRREAIHGLRKLKVTSATKAILRLTQDKDLLVKVYAIQTLGSFGKGARAALPTLKRLLKRPEYRTIRRHLRKSIAQIQ